MLRHFSHQGGRQQEQVTDLEQQWRRVLGSGTGRGSCRFPLCDRGCPGRGRRALQSPRCLTSSRRAGRSPSQGPASLPRSLDVSVLPDHSPQQPETLTPHRLHSGSRCPGGGLCWRTLHEPWADWPSAPRPAPSPASPELRTRDGLSQWFRVCLKSSLKGTEVMCLGATDVGLPRWPVVSGSQDAAGSDCPPC